MEVATVIPGLERLAVTVTRVLWGPAADAFAMALARPCTGEVVKIAGAIGDVRVGDWLDVEGQWQQDPQHGAQFAVQ